MEKLLWLCILKWSLLFKPNGIIMDAGANNGKTTIMLAQQFKNFTIIGVEPILTNVAQILHGTKHLKNVVVQHAGLGNQFSYKSYPDYLDKKKGSQIGEIENYKDQRHGDKLFPIYTVKHLVKDKLLSFAHWDVEGSEIELLEGAYDIIQRDRPIFTVESFPITNETRHNILMRQLKNIEYVILQVDEICGWPKDCRNYVCIPKEVYRTNLCDNTTNLI